MLDVLRRFDWPGNVRQLRNTIERAAILAAGPTITAGSLHSITATGVEDDAVVGLVELDKQLLHAGRP